MNKFINKKWIMLYQDTKTIAVPINKIEAIYENLQTNTNKRTYVLVNGKEYYTCMTMENVLENLDVFDDIECTRENNQLYAAGPWEIYSEKMYEELKNEDGAVLGIWRDEVFPKYTPDIWYNTHNEFEPDFIAKIMY